MALEIAPALTPEQIQARIVLMFARELVAQSEAILAGTPVAKVQPQSNPLFPKHLSYASPAFLAEYVATVERLAIDSEPAARCCACEFVYPFEDLKSLDEGVTDNYLCAECASFKP